MKIAHFISGQNRKRKYSIFLSKMKPKENTTILDVGFSDNEYSPNDNYLEKHYQWQNQITALGIDKPINFPKNYPQVRTIQYNGGEFPFPDNSFDICYSNAVIEHVGDKEKQLLFLKELNRVGRKIFITTPNRGFPIEVHTRLPIFHWFPKPIFDNVATFFGKKFATGNYMNLLFYKQIVSLFEEANINNFKIIKNRKFGFTMDFVVIISNTNDIN